MPEIKILNREILSDAKYRLEKITYNYTDRNDKDQTAQREVYHRTESAAILLYDPERKKILLTEQLRLPVNLHEGRNGRLLEACAGMIDKGELPEQSIIREVEEETGYRISEIQRIGEAYPSPAALTEYMYLFFGKYSPDMRVNEGGGKEEEGEDISIIEIPFAEARQKLLSGSIRDLKTILLLQHAAISNII